jgi:hypothetical protein
MTARLLAVFAAAVFIGFLAILVRKVPSPDLVIVTAITAGLLIWDFFVRPADR